MEKLKTSYGVLNIYLNRIDSPDESLVHLSFVDKNNKAHIVLMKRRLDKYVFVEPEKLAGWIIDLQQQLNELIRRDFLEHHVQMTTL
jgi:hypothetical protein